MYLRIKRMFDLLISLSACIIFSPVFFLIMILIKLDSKGPCLFKQARLTKDGRVFTMYKFRSMIENAENMGTGLFNYADDFRVTRIGKFLRKSSLDELPQLLNVLKGDMSIVGPRPPVSYELGNYCDLSEEYKKRFNVVAGITGLAQISGRNEIQWNDKVKLDNQYVDLLKKYGILIDIKIIFLTFISIFSMKNIYEVKDESLENLSEEEIAVKATNSVIEKAASKNYNS